MGTVGGLLGLLFFGRNVMFVVQFKKVVFTINNNLKSFVTNPFALVYIPVMYI